MGKASLDGQFYILYVVQKMAFAGYHQIDLFLYAIKLYLTYTDTSMAYKVVRYLNRDFTSTITQ